jgi:uncharacterized protein involved in type VI secretion and phage assembly
VHNAEAQDLMDVIDRMRNRFYGKYRGTVTEVEDSQENGHRIKARVPAVLRDQPTGWCIPCVPYAGDQSGIAFLPEINAGVWIEFEGGDVSYPIWAGCYWHKGEMPRVVDKEVRVIKTSGNQQIVLDDKEHSITISDSNGNSVTLDRDGIAIVRGSGKLAITDGKVSANDGAMEVT